MYFEKFPAIVYPFEIDGKTVYKKVTDITLNVRIFEILKQYATVYDEYDMLEGETPEIISEKAYGSPYYHWVIMLLNERYDYVNDFPMDQVTLDTYIKDKYNVEFKIECSQLTSDLGTQYLHTDSTDRLVVGQRVSYFVDYVDSTQGNHIYYDTKTSTITDIIDSNRFAIDETILSQSTTTETAKFLPQSVTVTIGNLDNPMYDVHHYVDSDGFIVNEDNVNLNDEPDAIEVTNYEHEIQQNESKRRIKLMSNQNLFSMLAQFKNLI